MNLRDAETTKARDVAVRDHMNAQPTKGERHYVFESFEALTDIPVDEAKSILLEQAQFMHGRLIKVGAYVNDPASHVSAFWEKIEDVLSPSGRFYLARDLESRVTWMWSNSQTR